MTSYPKHAALAATAIIAATPAAFAAGVYSAANGFTVGAPDNPVPRSGIVVWENAVVAYAPAPGVSASFKNPTAGLTSLGDLYNPLSPPAGATAATHGFIGTNAPGSITLSFANPITDGSGADFAVFENGFINGANNQLLFAEFAYVEVSSDGVNFARFASISTNSAPTAGSGAFAYYDVTNVYNLAGKHAANWGTPFDLAQLANDTLVINGLLDLAAVTQVRLVDVVGSGSLLDSSGNEIPGIAKDSLGNPIRDNWVTTGSGGFDYLGLPSHAIGVLNSVQAIPEPGSFALVTLSAGLLLRKRRR